MRVFVAVAFAIASIPLGAHAEGPAGDTVRGRELYETRCIACHSIDADRVGPHHRGLLGRRAGSVAGFDYSPALHGAQFNWDAAMLDRWLANPEATVPGQRMNYQVPDARDRADLIAYLATAR